VPEKQSVADEKMLHFLPNYFFTAANQKKKAINPYRYWVFFDIFCTPNVTPV